MTMCGSLQIHLNAYYSIVGQTQCGFALSTAHRTGIVNEMTRKEDERNECERICCCYSSTSISTKGEEKELNGQADWRTCYVNIYFRSKRDVLDIGSLLHFHIPSLGLFFWPPLRWYASHRRTFDHEKWCHFQISFRYESNATMNWNNRVKKKLRRTIACANWIKQNHLRQRMHEGNGGHTRICETNTFKLCPVRIKTIRRLSPFEWVEPTMSAARWLNAETSPVCLLFKRKIWLNIIIFSCFECLFYEVQRKIENPPDDGISDSRKRMKKRNERK